MIINLLLNVLIGIVGVFFSWLPAVDTLPSIFGFDIDGALVSGMGQLNFVRTQVWALNYLFLGFLFIMGYFGVKMVVRLFLGSRTPQ